MALQMLCAACLFLDRWCRPVTAAAFVLALALLYLSRSAAALSAAALSLVPLFAVAAWLRGRDVAGMALGVCIALAGIGCSVLASRGGELFAGALADLGKDNTLTGRTILWQFGIDQFWREPLLGIGYKAYWESPTTTAAYLHYSMKQKLWFFHNNFLDVAVAFGLVGLTVFVMGLLASARRSLTCLAHHPCYAGAWPLLFCLFVTVLSGFENVLFQNHSVQQFFLAAAMPPGALALARGMASRPRREGRSSPLGTGAARASPSMT